MRFEVVYKLWNGYENSHITEEQTNGFSDFRMEKSSGWPSVGFRKEGKSRYTWIPMGANVVEIGIYEAETGRRVWNWKK